MKPGMMWPVAIVSVLAITVAANVVLIVAANDPKASVVEPDYYRKAVAFDSTMAERAADLKLGWRMEARLGAPGTDGTRLETHLTDASGVALDGALVNVVAVHNLDAGHPVNAALLGTGAGRYAAKLPLTHEGRWELRFAVQRGAQRFSADLHQDTGTLP